MIEKIVYISDDGKQFDDKNECITHEAIAAEKTRLTKAKDILKEYCCSHSCDDCLLGNATFCSLTDEAPCEW